MNPNKIPWMNYQDVPIADFGVRRQFNTYMENGQFSEAISLLQSAEERLAGKAYVADTINKIIFGVEQLESKFNDGVNVFLSNLAEKIFSIINSIRNVGQWDINSVYVPYNFVENENKTYMAIKRVPANTPITNADFWLPMTLKGDEGVGGLDVNVRYNWSATRQYAKNDLVVYKDNLYVAKTENIGREPTGKPIDVWNLFIVINKGNIHVGQYPPEHSVKNSIWFRTKIDVDNSPRGGIGTFVANDGKDYWIPMYPRTSQGRIADHARYLGSPVIIHLVVNPKYWEYNTFTFRSPLIKASTKVKVTTDDYSSQNMALFNKLKSVSTRPGECNIEIYPQAAQYLNRPLKITLELTE